MVGHWYTIGKLRKFEGWQTVKVCKMVNFAWHAACCEPAAPSLFHKQLLVLEIFMGILWVGHSRDSQGIRRAVWLILSNQGILWVGRSRDSQRILWVGPSRESPRGSLLWFLGDCLGYVLDWAIIFRHSLQIFVGWAFRGSSGDVHWVLQGFSVFLHSSIAKIFREVGHAKDSGDSLRLGTPKILRKFYGDSVRLGIPVSGDSMRVL